MKLQSLTTRRISIPFRHTFKHASATRSETEALLVCARSLATVGVGEGCPRAYVTHETLESAERFVALHHDDWLRQLEHIEALSSWRHAHRALIDDNPAAWCGVELAVLDLLGKASKQSVESLLGVPTLRGVFEYTAVLGDCAQEEFESQLRRYISVGFAQFKVKLSGDMSRDLGKVVALRQFGINPESVRFDANNLWREASTAIQYLADLSFPFFAVEEPLGARDYDGMRAVAVSLGVKIVLDESCVRVAQLEQVAIDPEHWIVNIRVSKMGGLYRALDVVSAAKRLNVPVIVSAHVGETSVLARAGLTVAAAARPNLLAMEGAFGTHLLSSDVVAPSVMFGVGGRLDAATLPDDGSGGLGLVVDPSFIETTRSKDDARDPVCNALR